MIKVKVNLQPIVHRINMPTVIKTTILPGDSTERLFIATQVGEIFYIINGTKRPFLDIRSKIIKLGSSGGKYDERGLLGLAFHPQFNRNGLFYIHYSVAGTQGSGALSRAFRPNPCDPTTVNLKWTNRETQYDHIDTVEEWSYQSNGQSQKRRTLLYIRRPFSNHNGVNSLNFSPETGKLILTTGDGGLGYDPFNLSQDPLEIAGKIIEIDVNKNVFVNNLPTVTRFNELPVPIQEILTVIAKGVRNISGISFQKYQNQYIKYVGNVGQDLVESVFSFIDYKPIPVTQLIQDSLVESEADYEGFINLGWRGWEGALPTLIHRECSQNPSLDEKTIVYYNETVNTSVQRLQPLTSYFRTDTRPDRIGGTALTGVQPYMGNSIPDLKGNVVFTDLARDIMSKTPVRGVLAYTNARTDYKSYEYSIIEIDYDFGSQPAFYISLGTNLDQSRLYLGVYASMAVNDYSLGTIYEVIP